MVSFIVYFLGIVFFLFLIFVMYNVVYKAYKNRNVMRRDKAQDRLDLGEKLIRDQPYGIRYIGFLPMESTYAPIVFDKGGMTITDRRIIFYSNRYEYLEYYATYDNITRLGEISIPYKDMTDVSIETSENISARMYVKFGSSMHKEMMKIRNPFLLIEFGENERVAFEFSSGIFGDNDWSCEYSYQVIYEHCIRVGSWHCKYYKLIEEGKSCSCSFRGRNMNRSKPCGVDDTISDDKYVASKSSQIFHLLSCDWVSGLENRIYFRTPKDAIDSGRKPCKQCKPEEYDEDNMYK